MEPIESQFQVVPLDEETTINGHLYSAAQRAVIQNLIAGYAHDHLNVQYDCTKPHEAAIKQAAIKGAINALQHLIDAHHELQLAKDDIQES